MHVMKVPEGTKLPLTYAKCQRQRGLNCGLHAIALATAFALKDEMSGIAFEHTQLWSSLANMFEKQKLTAFPQMQEGKAKKETFFTEKSVPIAIPKLWHKLILKSPTRIKKKSKKF